MSKTYYDLTELFTASSKFHFYGIARVVAEVAVALQEMRAQVTFVVYSPALKDFVKVEPKFSDNASGFTVDLGVGKEAQPVRLRQHFHRVPALLRPMAKAYAMAIRAIDSRRWAKLASPPAKVDMREGVLISAARPKIMVEFLNAFKAKPGLRFMPLLHDMIPIHYATSIPEILSKRSFDKNFYFDNCAIIQASYALLANSEFTRADIQRLSAMGLLPAVPGIHAVPLAHECRGSQEPLRTGLPAPGYFMCVGATVGRKNLETVLDAMALMAKPPRLVLAGSNRKRVQALLQTSRYQAIAGKVEAVTAPNQAELVHLYSHSRGLIIASRLEGWGLPAGEALWWGTQAICADIPVLREVCGNRAAYFHPDRPGELAKLLETSPASVGGNDAGIRVNPRSLMDARKGLRTWADVAQNLLRCIDATNPSPSA